MADHSAFVSSLVPIISLLVRCFHNSLGLLLPLLSLRPRPFPWQNVHHLAASGCCNNKQRGQRLTCLSVPVHSSSNSLSIAPRTFRRAQTRCPSFFPSPTFSVYALSRSSLAKLCTYGHISSQYRRRLLSSIFQRSLFLTSLRYALSEYC